MVYTTNNIQLISLFFSAYDTCSYNRGDVDDDEEIIGGNDKVDGVADDTGGNTAAAAAAAAAASSLLFPTRSIDYPKTAL